jgi:Mn2+/Fe2+ NRAMP family transporter
VFATLGTIVLQEMSARLGVVGGIGLGEAIRRLFVGEAAPARQAPVGPLNTLLRLVASFIVVGAIGVGNAAYQTGNLLGASLGLEGAFGGTLRVWVLLVALIASALLWTGNYRVIERALVGMVIVMSVVFLVTAIGAADDIGALLDGALVPRLPDESAVVVALGLIGTTIVPYNLFLHSNAARERWHGESALPEARADLIVAIGLGGIISMAIVVTAASIHGVTIDGAAAMAAQLEPLLGRWARLFFAVGLFAAGLTSAITAPLAAAYAMSGILGWVPDLRSPLPRAVWMVVMLTGVGFALAGIRPVPAILFAQAMNGVLLPAVAFFLLVVMNDTGLLRGARNGWLANTLGVVVVALAAVLGVRALLGALR